jgi:GT2 family glycosyltransferase
MVDEIHAVVLTYNRRELVLRCVRALLGQTLPFKSIIVVDNGSSDGTQAAITELASPLIDYVRIEKNIGAARGFNHAMDYAYSKRKVTWAYIMDDDVIAGPTAVAELVAAYERNFTAPEQIGFLVSQAVDGQGRANNVPAIDTRPRRLGECPDWGQYLDQGIVTVRAATLSGMLMPLTTYEAFGNLNPEFVVWGEDLEYTFRITEHRPGLIVGQSKITHLRSQPGDISIFLENDRARVPNFYYLYRNQMYVRRRYMGLHAYANGLVRGLFEAARLFAHGDLWKAQIALRGTVAGLTFNPKVPLPSGQPAVARAANGHAATAAHASAASPTPPS